MVEAEDPCRRFTRPVAEGLTGAIKNGRPSIIDEIGFDGAATAGAAPGKGRGFVCPGENPDLLQQVASLVDVKHGRDASSPSGAVVAFDITEGCPDGWEGFQPANGRVIVGVGSSDGLSNRTFRERGGRETVTLSREQLPFEPDVRPDGGNGRENYVKGLDNSDPAPHENMPPFIALHFCKKLN